jgi:GGDEF domain-containing protein
MLRRRLDSERRARRAAEEVAELAQRNALHDQLTGLLSRPLFLKCLSDAIARPGADPITVFHVGLDRFKRVNDTLTCCSLSLAVSRAPFARPTSSPGSAATSSP